MADFLPRTPVEALCPDSRPGRNPAGGTRIKEGLTGRDGTVGGIADFRIGIIEPEIQPVVVVAVFFEIIVHEEHVFESLAVVDAGIVEPRQVGHEPAAEIGVIPVVFGRPARLGQRKGAREKHMLEMRRRLHEFGPETALNTQDARAHRCGDRIADRIIVVYLGQGKEIRLRRIPVALLLVIVEVAPAVRGEDRPHAFVQRLLAGRVAAV